MASADIEQLSPDSPLKPLYVIHGEEDLLRIEALDTLRAAAKRQGYLNREVYTADNAFDWNELLQPAANPVKTAAKPCNRWPSACPKTP